MRLSLNCFQLYYLALIYTIMSESEGQLQDYSVDQLGGFVVMVAGAIGSLLLVVWQSKCHCKVNCCYLFQCERRPPSEEEMKGLKEQAMKLKEKKDKEKADEDIVNQNTQDSDAKETNDIETQQSNP